MPEMVTPEELALINRRFAKEPLEAAYCIPMMAADTERLIDDRALKLHETTIAKFAKDANERGPNFQLAHWTMTQPIPLGKVFAGVDGGGKLFTKAYMPVGVTVPNMIGGEFKTDEIAKAYSAGLADRVSIGFSFERAECNLCFEDIRSPDCPHLPGKHYETDNGSLECTPIIFAGEKGMLHEISLVPQGALDNAKTVKRADLPTGFAATESTPGDIFAKAESLPEVSFGQFSVVLHPQGAAPTIDSVQAFINYAKGTFGSRKSSVGTSDADFALTHNSETADSEPAWGSVDKTKLPRHAFAETGTAGEKSSWKYPHHWVKDGGGVNEMGCYTTGEMYLHRGGLRAARAAAAGARSGQEANQDVKAHLNEHAKAANMGENQLAVLDEWMFDPEWLEHPILGPAFDRLTDAEWAALGEAIDSEVIRLTDETMRLSLEQYQCRTDLEQRLTVQAANIAGLQVRVESLSKMADLGKQYCDTLKAKAIETGIKCMGNAFKADFYAQVFSEALEKGETSVVTAAIEAWESEFKARVPAGRQTVGATGDRAEVVPATPDGKFDYLVRAKLKAEDWPFDRYGDAASVVGREHPDLVAAMRAQVSPHAE